MSRISMKLGLLLAILIWHSPSTAQSDATEAEPETRKCIPTRFVRRTRIVDDRSVLIYLSSRRVYLNVLRDSCSGLKQVGTFSYNSSDGLMCEGDGISSISGAWGEVRPIPTCWLGIHTKISKERADAILAASKRGPSIKARPVPPPDPSEIGTESEEPEGSLPLEGAVLNTGI